MRQKSCSVREVLDALFWLFLAILPVIMYLFHICCNYAPMTFSAYFLETLSVELSQDSVIYQAFYRIFTVGNGFFDIFENMGAVIDICVWLFFVEFLHVMFDVLVFLPRWCHSMMNAYVSRR